MEHFGPGIDRGRRRRVERHGRGRCATMDADARPARTRGCACSRAAALSFGQVPEAVMGRQSLRVGHLCYALSSEDGKNVTH